MTQGERSEDRCRIHRGHLPCVYILDEKVKNVVDHPIVRPTLNATAYTFDIAQDPKYGALATATSSLTGDRVNRFNHLLLSQEDLYPIELIPRNTGLTPPDPVVSKRWAG